MLVDIVMGTLCLLLLPARERVALFVPAGDLESIKIPLNSTCTLEGCAHCMPKGKNPEYMSFRLNMHILPCRVALAAFLTGIQELQLFFVQVHNV